jgi:hypothetical protein
MRTAPFQVGDAELELRRWLTGDPPPNAVAAPGLPVIISAERPARVAHRVFAHPSHSPGLYEHLTSDPRQHEFRAGRGIAGTTPIPLGFEGRSGRRSACWGRW